MSPETQAIQSWCLPTVVLVTADWRTPIIWADRELESTVTRFLKKWAGLAKCTNITLLYLPTKRSGLNLSALTSLYKRLQVSRQSQLLMSPDGSVRLLVERNLQHELSMLRKKFKLADMVKKNLPLSTHVSADLGSDYNFPQHITSHQPTWSQILWGGMMVQMLTIPFGTTMANAAERKQTRYEELIQSTQKACYTQLRSSLFK